MLREAGLDRRLELDDPVPERLRDLLRHEAGVEQVELAANERLGAVGPGRRDVAEEVGVGERIGERELGRDATLLVLLGRRDVRVPPGQRRCLVQGAQPLDGPLDDGFRFAHGARRVPDERRRETTIALVGTDAHRAAAAELGPIAVGVITVSDSRTPDDDTNGHWLHERIPAAGAVVSGYRVVRDEPDEVRAAVDALVEDARIVVVNGGTGVSRRDTTYDTLAGMLEKTLPGFGELFRMLSWEQVGSAAMLSRATAGTYHGAVVVSVPGSPKAVALAWEKLIEPELAHLAWELGR